MKIDIYKVFRLKKAFQFPERLSNKVVPLGLTSTALSIYFSPKTLKKQKSLSIYRKAFVCKKWSHLGSNQEPSDYESEDF